MIIKSKDISIDNKELIGFIKKQTPESYIDYCTKSKLKMGEKARLTKIWTSFTKYTIEDLSYARNRHPYWKKKKQKGSVERNQIRRAKYDFYDRKKYVTKKLWSDDELWEFIELNDKKRDWELARHFERSIPSIQFVRRKIQTAIKLAQLNNKRVDKNYLYKTIYGDDNLLRKQYHETLRKSKKK